MIADSPVVTLDVDWAPDFMIDAAARRLLEAGVRATWFVTHGSAAIERLAEHPELFELGIHPNFMRGSSHGASPAEVLGHLLELVPGAACVRNHGLVQSTEILDLVIRTDSLRIDVTHFLPLVAGLRPFTYSRNAGSLIRVPFFFEDDFEMARAGSSWSLDDYLSRGPGLKVFDFHPVHLYLNSPSMDAYARLKARCPQIEDVPRDEADSLIERGPGPADLLDELIARLARAGDSLTISTLVDRSDPTGDERTVR